MERGWRPNPGGKGDHEEEPAPLDLAGACHCALAGQTSALRRESSGLLEQLGLAGRIEAGDAAEVRRRASLGKAGLKLAQHHPFDVTNRVPVFGALPPVPGDSNPTPLFMGVSGGLW